MVRTSIFFYALPKLTGLAKKWYDGLTNVKYTPNEWQQKLLRVFPVNQNYGDIISEMFARKSRRKESLVEYYYDKIRLINRCELKGKQEVDCQAHGIYETNIRMYVQGARFIEPEKVLNYLRSISTTLAGNLVIRRSPPETCTTNTNPLKNF